MCLTFGCNPQIIFCYVFGSSELVIFLLKAFGHWVSCERNLSCNFIQIVLKLFRCFCQVLNMLTFGCNPRIIFCYFFAVRTKSY